MGRRIGVIDLGSNTFHLLVVDIDAGGAFHTMYKHRSFVGLAEDGIEILSISAMERGISALSKMKTKLAEYGVSEYSVIGTSALRSADNRYTFIDRARQELGIDIEVIDGQREAELIYRGVDILTPDSLSRYVIMDIGGGSVEFIIVEGGDIRWAHSFDIGVGVLYNIMSYSDPITTREKTDLDSYLDQALLPLRQHIDDYGKYSLLGASGSFEVIQSMNGQAITDDRISEVAIDVYHTIATKVIQSTTAERVKMDGLPGARVKLIVVAMLLINKAIEIICPDELLVSPYALKEGVISEKMYPHNNS